MPMKWNQLLFFSCTIYTRFLDFVLWHHIKKLIVAFVQKLHIPEINEAFNIGFRYRTVEEEKHLDFLLQSEVQLSVLVFVFLL